MIEKIVENAAAALADVPDGATVMIGGFGTAGQPDVLIDALIAQGARELVIVNNNAGNGDVGLAALLAAGRVRKIVCSFPRQVDSHHFDRLYRAGEIELELVPQGNLSARLRAAAGAIGRPGPASAASSRRLATAPSSQKARRRARSTAACTSSSRRCTPTMRSS